MDLRQGKNSLNRDKNSGDADPGAESRRILKGLLVHAPIARQTAGQDVNGGPAGRLDQLKNTCFTWRELAYWWILTFFELFLVSFWQPRKCGEKTTLVRVVVILRNIFHLQTDGVPTQVFRSQL